MAMAGPDQIGRDFVERYHGYLENGQLDMIVALYRPESKMVRWEEEIYERVENLPDIVARIMSLDYAEIVYDSVSEQSWNQGILVVVIGILRTARFMGTRKFKQIFFLVPTDNNAHFILNDIFCFIGDKPDKSVDPTSDDTDPNPLNSAGEASSSRQLAHQMAMYIRVKRHKTTYFLQCDPTETVLELKQKLEDLIDQPVNDQRLILLATGNVLNDSNTLADQKVENDSVVALTLRKDDHEFEDVNIVQPTDFYQNREGEAGS